MAMFHAELPKIFAALSDPTRLAVVERLVAGPASVSELGAPFTMAGPSFLKHLRVLEDAGLVRTEKKGRVRTCTLQPATLRWAEEWIGRHRRRWDSRFDDLGQFLQQGND